MKQLFFYSLILVFTTLFLNAQEHNVLNFGAVADGKTLNTTFIQSAIDKANEEGGGTVVIPKGRFLSGTIVMKSNVELKLMNNSVLLGSTNPKDYKKLNRWKALVMADGVNNISISGKGTIDGQGAQLALHIDSLFYVGETDSADYNFIEKRPKYYTRPQVIEFVNCKNVKVSGVTIKNSACWVQTYDLCRNVTIDNIRVQSDAYWNNDGIDIVDCKNVRITNCYINAADDGICLKSSISNNRTDMVYHGSNFCDSIYIENCTVRSSASAIKLGARSVGGFKNITIKNIKVFDTYRSAIALESVDGGTMENVLIENIKAKNTGNALFIRLGHRLNARDEGSLKNVIIRKMTVEIAKDAADLDYNIRGPVLPYFHNIFPSSITGIPGHPVKNVKLENIKITYPGKGIKAYANMPVSRLKEVPENINHYPEFSMFGELPSWGLYLRHVEGITMKDIKIKIRRPDYRPAVVIDDALNVKVESIKIDGDKKPMPIILSNTKKVEIIN